ncbi:MAG: hypothetical protein Q8K59_01305 [Nitrosomonas sp.]|nr:hypothetical protein [Nitrosomonas sp.]MDP1949738.1 hypothetical protein [Nitrosomonas sp.]
MDITIFDITFVSLIIILGLLWYKVISTKKKMEKTEKTLESGQFLPECGDISHGMVITKNGIEGDEKPTLNWISKLPG